MRYANFEECRDLWDTTPLSCCLHCKWMQIMEPATLVEAPEVMAILQGRCVRRAPIADQDGEAIWPSVQESDWCGDFERTTRTIDEFCFKASDDEAETNAG